MTRRSKGYITTPSKRLKPFGMPVPSKGKWSTSKQVSLSFVVTTATLLAYICQNSEPKQFSPVVGPTAIPTTIPITIPITIPKTIPKTTKKKKGSTKYILFYTGFWDKPDFRIGYGEDPFSRCPVKACYTTNNRSLLSGGMSDFDAIVMHGAEFRLHKEQRDYIQSWRQDYQRFVFFMMEPPTSQDFSWGYDNFWHYTMTYRSDSDILRPYGFVVPKEDARDQYSIPRAGTWAINYNETDFIENVLPKKSSDFLALAKRPKKIAWVVSNCNARSRREAYVKELQNYIDIDIFGRCGSIECNVKGTLAGSGNCATTVKEEYKFYLSFENTFAKDYVTEKLFLRMNMDLVPIVLGQADYNHTAPPHSFINVLDYDSPKALADYLHRLDRNETEYLSYLWWKDYYHVESQTMMQLAFCDLCAKLHESGSNKTATYANFGKWWHEDAHLDEQLQKVLNMIGEQTPSESKVAQQTPSLRMSLAG